MTWPTVRLRRVTSLAYGDSLADDGRRSGSVKVFGSNGPVGEHDQSNTRAPVVVVGRKGSFGKVQFSEEPVFAIDTTYFVDQSQTRAHLRWLYYLLQSLRLDALSTDVGVPGLSRERVYEQRVRLPPLTTQRAIADYLDRETARIDALIGAKRRMMDLLSEIFVSRLEASMSRSEVSLVPLRRLLSGPPQYGASETGHDPVEGWPRYIRITDFDPDGALRRADVKTLPPSVARPYLLEVWDILLARSGATVGKVFAYRAALGQCCFAGYLVRFRFDRQKILPGLVDLWAHTDHYWDQIKQVTLQATIENVSAERYKDLMVPVPPRERQAELLQVLGTLRAKVQRAQRLIQAQIDLLSERRKAVITAGIIGGIRSAEVA